MMTAMPNKHYSGHHEAVEKRASKEHLEKRSGDRNGDSRIQMEVVDQDRNGWRKVVCGLWPLAVTYHKLRLNSSAQITKFSFIIKFLLSEFRYAFVYPSCMRCGSGK